MELDQFNDMKVSAPVPGRETRAYEPETRTAQPVEAQQVAPEPEPQPEAEPQVDSRQLVEESINEGARRQSFAEKRRMAELELAERERAALARIEAIEGLAAHGEELQRNPRLAQRVAQAYDDVYDGQQEARTYSEPRTQQYADGRANEELARMSQRFGEMERRLGIEAVHAAAQIIQGRHHVKQEDMNRVVQTAIDRKWLRPGMTTLEAEQALEDARRITLFDRARSEGQKAFVEQIEKKAQAVTSQGAAQGASRQVYDTRGKSFADIRRDAKLAGAKGL